MDSFYGFMIWGEETLSLQRYAWKHSELLDDNSMSSSFSSSELSHSSTISSTSTYLTLLGSVGLTGNVFGMF